MKNKQNLYEEILEAIRSSADPKTGTVYLRKNQMAELFADGKETSAPPVPHAAPPARVPVSRAPAAPVAVRTPHADVSGASWEALEKEVRSCQACKLGATRTNVVFGDGSRTASLMFIGEGPGYDEDQQGLPFVGAAGQLLTKMIQAMHLERADVYIGNIVKCRPPGNRKPEDDEGACCLPFIVRQIELIQPKVIVLLGATPLKFLLNQTGISRCRGTWRDYRGIKVMPTYHPAYLLRNPAAKRDVWNDLKQVMTELGLAPARP